MNFKAQSRDKKVDKLIGATIKRMRHERKMSQSGLGHLLHVSFQQIQKYETGANSVAAARVPALCKALGISLQDLFEGIDINPPRAAGRGMSSKK